MLQEPKQKRRERVHPSFCNKTTVVYGSIGLRYCIFFPVTSGLGLLKKRCTFVSITSVLSSSVKRWDISSADHDMPGGRISIREAWFDGEFVSWTISLPLHRHLHLLPRMTIMVSNDSWLYQVEGKKQTYSCILINWLYFACLGRLN